MHSLLLFVTTYKGLEIIFLLLFSVFLTTKILNRDDKKGKSDFVRWGYIFLILMVFNFVAFSILCFIFNESSIFFTGKKYTAVVTNIDSYTLTEDGDDGSQISTVFYTPSYTFTNASGQTISRRSSVSSNSSPSIGDSQTIMYNKESGQLVELSIGNILLLAIGLLFSSYCLFLISGVVRYAFNKSIDPVIDLFVKTMKCFFSLGMLLMGWGMTWYVYQRLFNGYKSDQSVWVLVTCILLTVVIVIYIIWGFTKILRKNGRISKCYSSN